MLHVAPLKKNKMKTCSYVRYKFILLSDSLNVFSSGTNYIIGNRYLVVEN